MEANMELILPESNQALKPGYKVKLGRFSEAVWTVRFGWFSHDNNRPWCGWYLTTIRDHKPICKPLQLPDLDDIYLVEICPLH